MCRTTFCRSGEQRPVLLPRNPHRGRVGVAAVCEDKLCTVCSSQASASFGALHKSFRGTPFGHPKTKLLSHVFSSGAHVWSHHATPQIRAERHEGLGPQVLTETDNYLVTCPLRYVRKGGRRQNGEHGHRLLPKNEPAWNRQHKGWHLDPICRSAARKQTEASRAPNIISTLN